MKIKYSSQLISEFITHSSSQTEKSGEEFSQKLKEKDVVLLIGNLGSGKTTFTKGIARGLGIKSLIRSPSFTLVREYKKKDLVLYHIDLYRLSYRDMGILGLDDYFYKKKSLAIVEWGEKIKKSLNNYFSVHFYVLGEMRRKIVIKKILKR